MDLQNNYRTAERLMRYAQVDTQSDPESDTSPSTEKQKDLSAMLVAELLMMGIEDAHMDEYGYVYATIPANTHKDVPVICFCSHVDTAPDCSGTNVKPILHQHYNGNEIVLPDDPAQIISTAKYPYLKQHIGKDIITASGNTLLGADDKAGVAIIMSMADHLMHHPEIKHGDIRILFTPDEEVGRGTDHLDMKKLGAAVGYTLDGAELGTLEDETFSADGVKLIVHGVIAHPGYAKGILVNALKIAAEIVDALPKTEWSPETTDKRQGFVHPVAVNGIAEKATIDFIVRDFTVKGLQEHETRLKHIAETVLQQYPNCSMEFIVKEQYRNMKEMLDQHPAIVSNAIEAYERCGLTVIKEPIRGGTDGSRLSYMGLPCPNLFTGMQAIHSKHEWIGVADMEQSANMLAKLVQVWEEKS
ncbi:MAG: peptidase T [Chitinophagaceae bacterium]|jgi:tripeptide aminopeptidase|nr:peptidase T [Chitinophagaceae bacterium]